MLTKKQFNNSVSRLRAMVTAPDLITMLTHQLTKANTNGEHNELLALLNNATPPLEGCTPLDRRRAENYLANALYGSHHSCIAHNMPKVYAHEQEHVVCPNPQTTITSVWMKLAYHSLDLKATSQSNSESLLRALRQAQGADGSLRSDLICSGKSFFESLTMAKEQVKPSTHEAQTLFTSLPLGKTLHEGTIRLEMVDPHLGVFLKLSTYNTKDALYRGKSCKNTPATASGLASAQLYANGTLVSDTESHPVFWREFMSLLVACMTSRFEQDVASH